MTSPRSWVNYLISLALILGINGYHPFSQDGGIYLPTVMQYIEPGLFATDRPFVVGHRHLSLFAPAVGGLIRATHLPLFSGLFGIYVLCALAFVGAVSSLAARLTGSDNDSRTVCLWAAALFCLPAAGTSLLLMDPYVTARSVTTPLTLYAIVAVMDRRHFRAAVLCVASVLLHPIMGVCCCFVALVLALTQERKRALRAGFLLAATLVSVIAAMPLKSLQSPAYREAVSSRRYLSLSGWAWFEVLGLIVPIFLLLFASARLERKTSNVHALCETCLIVAAYSLVVSLALVHSTHPSLLLRLQPLRLFHTVYVLGIVLLTVWAVARVRRAPNILGHTLAPAFLACAMFFANRASYPEARRFEFNPDFYQVGALSEAFHWVRRYTPPGATFSADQSIWKAHNPEEDGFRAETGRSILLDDKDEGLVTVFPDLSERWKTLKVAQETLGNMSDEQKKKQLAPFAVQFVLLPPDSMTHLGCPFRNRSVQVCHL